MRTDVLVYILVLIGISGIDLFPARVLSHENALMIQYAVYCGLVLYWSVSAGRRITERPIRRMQKIVVMLFLFMFFLSRLRRVVFEGIYPAEHLLWYAFYIPNLAIPLVSWYMTLYVGKEQGYRLPLKVKLWLIPYALLVAGILTNELHMLAFRFRERGRAVSIAGQYRVGPLYYLAQLWLFGFAILAILSLRRYLRRNHLNAYLLPPVLIMGAGFVYTVLYAFDRSPTGVGYVEPNVMTCFATLALWEYCISRHLIPSNVGYQRWFRACTVPIEILDKNRRISFASEGYRREENADRFFDDGQPHIFLSRQYPIGAGTVRWREDVTRNEELIRKLRENASLLSASNAKLATQNRMQMQAAKAREHTKLYERALYESMDEMDRMRAMLDACRGAAGRMPDAAGQVPDMAGRTSDAVGQIPDAETRKEYLARIGVLGAYVKRRSNLVLLSAKSPVLPLAELHFCLHESNEALVLIPVSTIYKNEADLSLTVDAADIMRAYDAFAAEMEALLGTMEYLKITLKTENGSVALSWSAGGEKMRQKDTQILFTAARQAG